MGIRKGEQWGTPGALPSQSCDAEQDRDLAQLIRSGATHARPLGGDLARTVGVSATSLLREAEMLLPVDAIRVTLDEGLEIIAAAHVLIGRRAQPKAAVMNAAFVGTWNIAPRAHPGDGLVDVVRFDLSLPDWYKARRRLPTGTHVPHPRIVTERAKNWDTEFERPMAVIVDGRRHRRVRSIRCEVIEQAITIGV